MPACKLHILWIYNPVTETYSCSCGANQVTKQELLARGEKLPLTT